MFDFSDKTSSVYQNFRRYVDESTNKPFSVEHLKKNLSIYEYGHKPNYEEIQFAGIEKENFLSKKECDHIITLAKTRNAWLQSGQTLDFWEGRNTPLFSDLMLAEDTENKYANIVLKIHDGLRELLRESFNDGKTVYCDQIGIVRWEPGSYQMTHRDDVDGMDRVCGAVIYLNDDYSGGETFYPFFEKSFSPKTGKVFAHSSNSDHLHGVTQIGGCTRYTISSTWSSNPEKNLYRNKITMLR